MVDIVKIGVIPIHRSFLNMEEALRQKQLFMGEIKKIRSGDVDIIDIDDICENGILNAASVEKVIEKMKANRADALFIAFCDFGEEVLAVRVATALKLPVLVWGARDEKPNTDEVRWRDTQCGMFAATKALARYGVTYSYIYNITSQSDEFRSGFEKFVRTVSVIKSLKGLRIAQIGQRPSSFMNVASNEGSLMEKFGIEVVPISVSSVVKRIDRIKSENANGVNECIEKLKTKIDTQKMTAERLISMAAFKLALRNCISESGCRAAALECWSVFPLHLGFTPCFMVGELTDEGYPISCETDLNGAVTSVMVEAAALRDSPTFFADLTIRHPQNDNAELLWHCGPFPYSLHDPDSKPFVAPDGRGRFPLKKGDITIARLDDLRGKYSMTAIEGKSVDGPQTTGTYTYFETGNWKRVEEKFIFGPYIHHVVGCYGNYSRILKEAARFIENIEWDDIDSGPASL